MKCVHIIITCLIILGFSCSEEVKPSAYEETFLFAGENSKTWKMKFVEFAFDGEVVRTTTDDCATDDRYTFYANNERSLQITTGSKKCDQNPEPNTIIDSWSFNNAAATLTMLYPPLTTEGSLPFIVREVKKNKMELEIFLDASNSVGYRIHFEATDED